MPRTKTHNLDIVPAHYYVAIKERYKGTTYTEIKQKIAQEFNKEYREDLIRHWFCKGGVLENLYEEYAEKMNAIERREAQDFAKGNLRNAFKMLANIMVTGNDAARVAAAKVFIDYGLGDPGADDKSSVVINFNDIDINSLNEVQALGLLERMRQLKNEVIADTKNENTDQG